MLGEIYLIVIFAVGMVTFCHFKDHIFSFNEDINDDIDNLNFPIYK